KSFSPSCFQPGPRPSMQALGSESFSPAGNSSAANSAAANPSAATESAIRDVFIFETSKYTSKIATEDRTIDGYNTTSKPSNSGWPKYVPSGAFAWLCALRKASELVQASKASFD